MIKTLHDSCLVTLSSLAILCFVRDWDYLGTVCVLALVPWPRVWRAFGAWAAEFADELTDWWWVRRAASEMTLQLTREDLSRIADSPEAHGYTRVTEVVPGVCVEDEHTPDEEEFRADRMN